MNPRTKVILLLVGLVGSACGVTTWKGAESGDWDVAANWAGGFPVSTSTVRLNHDRQTNAYEVIVQTPAITDKLWIDTYGDIPIHIRVNPLGSLELNSMRMGFKEDDRASSFTIDGGSVWGLDPLDPAITNTAFLIGNNPDCLATLSVMNNGLFSVQGSNGLIVASSKESIGRLIVTNGTMRIKDSLILGKGPGATGEMIVSGSSFISITGALHIAKLDNGALMPTGTVVMAEGTLECGTLNIGAHGMGSLTQTGGDIYAGSGGITLGQSNAEGQLNLLGGTLRAPNSFMNIGHTDSTGLLFMSNGVVEVSGTLSVGSGSRSHGQIDQTGGTISVGQLMVGAALSATGTLNLCGGEVLIQGSDDTDLQVSNGCINLQQTLIQWANTNVTEWITKAVSSGTLCFTNGLAAGTYSTNGYDGRLIHGDAALYWDNLDNGSPFAQSAIWVEQLAEVSPYDTWADEYNLIESGLTDDPDSDGLDNLSEYALGGNPTNANETGILPTFGTVEIDGTNGFEYVYRQRTDAEVLGLDYYLEQSTNLVVGAWTNNVDRVISIGPDYAGFEPVTNHVPADSSSLYIRLRIQLD